MQVFLNEFSVHHIRTSPYHPQSNGACERFNGTLKTMIRSLLDSLGTLLCHGGCSPVELMLGRIVPGLLQLVKSAWLQETD